jgi:hypothetical protein
VVADVWQMARLWSQMSGRWQGCGRGCLADGKAVVEDVRQIARLLLQMFIQGVLCSALHLERGKTEGRSLLVPFGLGGLCTCTSQL